VRVLKLCWIALVLAAALAGGARAQFLDTYLPASVPGLDRDQGVTVLSRLRPLYEDPGVRLGSFVVRGGVDEALGYDSNITGWTNGPQSPFVRTSPSISAASDWGRNRLGFDASLDQYTFFSAPRENYTNYNIALGGGWTILEDSLNAGYAHQHAHEFGNDIGAIAYGVPVTYDIDTVKADYTYRVGRLQFTPNVDLQLFQYGNAEAAGQTISQAFRDRTVLSGGLTTRYSLSDQRGLLLVLQGSQSHYLQPQLGAPSNNSRSVLVLPGLDYQASGPWRYRVLAGAELRVFDSPQYRNVLAPVVEASAIYTPTGLTTVTASIRREIQDPEAEGSSGLTFTGVKLVVDHEWLRNVLLQTSGEFGSVRYFDAGRSLSFGAGASATWLLNEHLSVSANYQFSRQDSAGSFPNSMAESATHLPSFTRNLLLLQAKWRL